MAAGLFIAGSGISCTVVHGEPLDSKAFKSFKKLSSEAKRCGITIRDLSNKMDSCPKELMESFSNWADDVTQSYSPDYASEGNYRMSKYLSSISRWGYFVPEMLPGKNTPAFRLYLEKIGFTQFPLKKLSDIIRSIAISKGRFEPMEGASVILVGENHYTHTGPFISASFQMLKALGYTHFFLEQDEDDKEVHGSEYKMTTESSRLAGFSVVFFDIKDSLNHSNMKRESHMIGRILQKIKGRSKGITLNGADHVLDKNIEDKLHKSRINVETHIIVTPCVSDDFGLALNKAARLAGLDQKLFVLPGKVLGGCYNRRSLYIWHVPLSSLPKKMRNCRSEP